MTTLRELQAQLRPWQEKNFPNRETWEPLVGVNEELGEFVTALLLTSSVGRLAHAHLKKHQQIRLDEDHDAAARDAVGDILVYLADYCNGRGFDMQECLDTAWAQVKQRDWVKHREEHKSDLDSS